MQWSGGSRGEMGPADRNQGGSEYKVAGWGSAKLEGQRGGDSTLKGQLMGVLHMPAEWGGKVGGAPP